MKYMGSKRAMLQNGLGELIASEIVGAHRFIDLFSGSAAVAWFAATKFPIEVRAFDLQTYSAILGEAVLNRKSVIDGRSVWADWERKAGKIVSTLSTPEHGKLTRAKVSDFRRWCALQEEAWVVTRAYGGHYFSPIQAVWFDALRRTIPRHGEARSIALAALIEAASKCAAAPGHTAQSFQPTRSAKRFLQEAWDRDVCIRVKNSLLQFADSVALRVGGASVQDANKVAETLAQGDLVFIDPPYSGVHYSRFYHVLETIAQGVCGEVSGVGRYPSPEKRPKSDYSIGTKSANALDKLLKTLASRKARAILTFPNHECSNGLSGQEVEKIASKHFSVRKKTVKSRFSTLGGNKSGKPKSQGRAARKNAEELILLLKEK